MSKPPAWQTTLLSVVIGLALLAGWHLATLKPSAPAAAAGGAGSEYARLAGAAAPGSRAASAIPTPGEVARRAGELLSTAFSGWRSNNQGLGFHLLDSLVRVLTGFAFAVAVAVPAGFALGLSPLLLGALNPYIQVLRPISPLAWMPLALYTLRDSAMAAIFVIFVCALWPLLINTTFGVAGVRSEWLNVARVMGLPLWKRIGRIVFPAALPMILTGMRISIGIAWLVIVAAEMVVGNSGVGYFVWNEWNNLQISSMIVAILLIGLVGLGLDQLLGAVQRRLAFRE